MHPISPSIDLLSHRAAIDALEAQRAAYRRFARLAESQQGALNAGDLEAAATFTEGAGRQVDSLAEGARGVRTLVDAVSHGATDVQMHEIERRMQEMMREARSAETAIRNLTTQLEAWRDAFGRQLGEVGITPGGGDVPNGAPRTGYGTAPSPEPPARILDRKG